MENLLFWTRTWSVWLLLKIIIETSFILQQLCRLLLDFFFFLALQIFLLLFKFSLQEMPDLLRASAVLLGSPAALQGSCCACTGLGEKDKPGCACLCCCQGLRALPCWQRAGHRLPKKMLDFSFQHALLPEPRCCSAIFLVLPSLDLKIQLALILWTSFYFYFSFSLSKFSSPISVLSLCCAISVLWHQQCFSMSVIY